jgi:hypothetical protein
MAKDPEADTPPFWNELAVELFDELKPLADEFLDVIFKGGLVPFTKPVTIEDILAMQQQDPTKAGATLSHLIQNPDTRAHGVQLFAQFLAHIERQGLTLPGVTGGASG